MDTKTLTRAVKIAGSMERLADFLCRPLADLVAWSRGVPIPDAARAALAEIVAAKALTVEALDKLARSGKPKRAILADIF